MNIKDVPEAIKEFKFQKHKDIGPLEPKKIGLSWAIGTLGDRVILVRKYHVFTQEIYKFTLVEMKRYNDS